MTAKARRRRLVALALLGVPVLLLIGAVAWARTQIWSGETVQAERSTVDDSVPAFTIRGGLTTPLSPGFVAEIDLELMNPGERDLLVREIVVAVASVTAPNARADLPCSVADFVVEQADGELHLAAGQTLTLSQAGWSDAWPSVIEESELPRVQMLDTNANQDGCKGASLSLEYRASAEVRR